MKKRTLLISGILLLFILLSIGAAYTAITYSQPALHQDTGKDTDKEVFVRNPLSSTGSCGVERWAVKTGTDANVSLISLQSINQTTIAALSALTPPATLPASTRIQPTETTVFQLHDTLTEYKLETDSDYHLVLADTSGKTMIVEIPDPACVGASSPLLADIQKARAQFDARYTPSTSFQTANVPVTVTGVGFFDFLHGQTGVAPNGIELHAVLDVQFDTGGTPTPTPTRTPAPVPTGTPAPTPTPAGTPSATNLIQNGSFEASSYWTFAGNPLPARSTTRAHSGSYALKVGASSGQQGDTTAYQTVTIPSSATSATLDFYYWPTTNDSSAYAWQEADVLNSSGQVVQQLFKRTGNDSVWLHVSFDLSKYAGQTIGVQFLDHENSNGSSSYYGYMYVDDVALTMH